MSLVCPLTASVLSWQEIEATIKKFWESFVLVSRAYWPLGGPKLGPGASHHLLCLQDGTFLTKKVEKLSSSSPLFHRKAVSLD